MWGFFTWREEIIIVCDPRAAPKGSATEEYIVYGIPEGQVNDCLFVSWGGFSDKKKM